MEPTERINANAAFFKYWLPLIFYCAAIFIQSSYPSPDIGPEWAYFDKFLHFLAYAGLGILFYRAYGTLPIIKNQNVLIFLSILSAALYGAGDELHQSFVSARHADGFDFLADMAGSFCGVLVFRLIRRPTDNS